MHLSKEIDQLFNIHVFVLMYIHQGKSIQSLLAHGVTKVSLEVFECVEKDLSEEADDIGRVASSCNMV